MMATPDSSSVVSEQTASVQAPAQRTEVDARLREYVSTSLVDLVTSQIRTFIFTGRYLAGQKLIVRELSDALGVSHTPVKDALNRLMAEGLVEAFPNRSMTVRRFTNNDLIDGLGVRLMCELYSAEEIVRNAAMDSAVIDDLQAILRTMQAVIDADGGVDYERWVDSETQFHRRYMVLAGNAKLVSVYCGLDSNRFTYFAYLQKQRVPLSRRTLEHNMTEHHAIIDAIGALDAQRFSRAVAAHVIRACEDYAIDEQAQARIEQIKRQVRHFIGDPDGASN
jgi:DNA-binding GntR family transcriptional regulator